LTAAAVERFGHGMSGDVTLRIGGAFAKLADPARRISRESLARETAALAWLDGRAGAPRLIWAGEVEGRPALVTEALPGVPLHDLPADRAEAGLVATIAALRALHSLSIDGCPLDQRLPVKLAEARQRIAEGEADCCDRAMFEALLAKTPAAEDLVFTHGDASLPNFIAPDAGPVGLVDLGLAGVADRYQDFALLVRSAAHNFPGMDARRLLVEHYPLADLDEAKLEFYRALDEFY
jgi:aminoglycoside phosphotransferase